MGNISKQGHSVANEEVIKLCWQSIQSQKQLRSQQRHFYLHGVTETMANSFLFVCAIVQHIPKEVIFFPYMCTILLWLKTSGNLLIF